MTQPFDLTVHHRDTKSGRTISTNNYVYVCERDKGSYYIRDGQRFSADGALIGPVEVAKQEATPIVEETKLTEKPTVKRI